MKHTLNSAFLQLRQTVLRALRGFKNSEQGLITIETLIVLPVVIWALLASVTFTDAFRHKTTLQKSVFTAGDLISRANGRAITPDYIDGVYKFVQRMNDGPHQIRIRITLIGWDEPEQQLRVVWSNGAHAGAFGPLDDVILNLDYAPFIPTITQGETLLLAEGWLDYTPPFEVGLSARTLGEMALLRPRFAPGISYDDPNAPPPPPAWCEFVVDACGM